MFQLTCAVHRGVPSEHVRIGFGASFFSEIETLKHLFTMSVVVYKQNKWRSKVGMIVSSFTRKVLVLHIFCNK